LAKSKTDCNDFLKLKDIEFTDIYEIKAVNEEAVKHGDGAQVLVDFRAYHEFIKRIERVPIK
jgi:hypothetical protein